MRLATFALLVLVPCVAVAQERPKAALMPLAAKNLAKETVEILDLLLAAELDKAGRWQLIGVSDINAMIGLEKMKQAAGCDDVACAAELGGALGVDVLISGTAGKLGDELVVQLTLIDIKASKVLRRGHATGGADERSYKAAIAAVVADALGLAKPPTVEGPKLTGAPLSPARFRFDTQEPRAFDVQLVASDGVQHRCPAKVTFEVPCTLEQVAIGESQIIIGSEPLSPMSRSFDVEKDRETVIFTVREMPSQGSIISWSLGGMALATGVALLALGIAMDEQGLVYGGIPAAAVGGTVVFLGFTFDGQVITSERHLREDGGSSWWPF
jgi:hypothetical protein